jgi:glucosamine-phosphate N-acetyltransferase
MNKETYLNVINNLSNHQYIFVMTDREKPIAMITLFIEQKLIHGGGKVGHIEDLIVDKTHRNKGYATKLIQHAIAITKLHQCYKCILNCTDDVKPFYEKNGFTQYTNGMSIYFKH